MHPQPFQNFTSILHISPSTLISWLAFSSSDGVTLPGLIACVQDTGLFVQRQLNLSDSKLQDYLEVCFPFFLILL